MAEADVFDSCGSSSKTNSNLSPEKQKLNSMITDLANDYSKYLKVDLKSEKVVLEDEMEDLLTRLDEFTSLVDMVRGDNLLCLSNTLPSIHSKCDELETIFSRIDKLEDVIQVIKQNLDVMEEKVSQAEEQLDNSSMKKLFSTLQKPLFSKKSETKKQAKYDPPEIFRTEDFFPSMKDNTTAPTVIEKSEENI